MTLVGLDAPTIISERHFSRVHSPVLRRGTCDARTRVLGHSGKLPQGKNLFYAQHAFFARDLFIVARTHAPYPVVAEGPRGNMLSEDLGRGPQTAATGALGHNWVWSVSTGNG